MAIKYYVYCFTILYFCFLHADSEINNNYQQTKVNVSIYYETLCGASVRFIQRQLYPTWMEMADYLNITFIPYGKAVQNMDTDGNWTFTCQHGPEECYGNKVQACALHVLKNDSVASVEYIQCFMTFNNFYPYNGTCFEDHNSNLNDKAKFEHCISTEEGDEVLATYGDLTFALNPRFSSVPAIVFNDIYDAHKDEQAMNNLKQVVCSQYTTSPAPEVCNVKKA